MKVLHLIDSGGLYGAENVLLNLVEEQVKQGIDIIICSIGNHNIFEKPFETEAIKRGFILKKFRMRPGPNIVGAFKLLHFAQNEKADVLHSHGYKTNILLGFIPRKYRKIPIVTTVHGWTNIAFFTKMRLYEWLDSKSFHYMDAVILVNKLMLRKINAKISRKIKIYVVNNGIPLINNGDNSNSKVKVTQNIDHEIEKFCKEGLIFGTIGRLSKEKGFNYLVEAFGFLQREVPNVKLLIIGEGRERRVLERQVLRLGIEDRVLMPGYLYQAYRFLPLFDIFILPSLTEGLPITILEAMKYSLPIIATNVGGVPEVLEYGEAGILVKPSDSSSLMEAMYKVHKNRIYAISLGNQARKIIENNYSSEKMNLEYYEIYKSIIRNNSDNNIKKYSNCI